MSRKLPAAQALPSPQVIYSNLLLALIDRRKELGHTQRDVDQIAGFSEGHVAKYETGARHPSAEHLTVWVASLNAHLILAPLTVEERVRRWFFRHSWRPGQR